MSERLKTILISVSLFFVNINPASGQLVPDRTLGRESSTVLPASNIRDDISGGAIRGSNLFHSFSEFNVAPNREVYFNNPVGIENIINRVTGNNISNISGTLGVAGNANLYLINPNGIIFGNGAKLDINNTFIGTTADGVRLGANDVYSASEPNTSNLLTVQPGALFVNRVRNATRSIVNRGNLEVKPGSNLTLSADAIANIGSIINPGGNVSLKADYADISTGNINTSSSIGNGGDINLVAKGNISIDNGSNLLANGRLGGSINLETKNAIEADNSGIRSTSTGSQIGKGGNISIIARSIEWNNSRLGSLTEGGADTGEIAIETNLLRFKGGIQIGTTTTGQGIGGNVTISARTIEGIGDTVRGNLTVLGSRAEGLGSVGNITINSDSIRLVDGALISTTTFGPGNAGNLTIAAKSVELIGANPLTGFPSALFADTVGSGSAGQIRLTTDLLRLENGAQIGGTTLAAGNGGNLTIVAQIIELTGVNPINRNSSGLFSSAINNNRGNGGNINLSAKQLKVSQGATISANNFRANRFPPGLGKTGNIKIEAEEIILDRGEITASGNIRGGGEITIDSRNLIFLKNESQITTNVRQSIFPGGNIKIDTPIIIANPALNRITARAITSSGGNIDINIAAILGYPQFLAIDATSALGIDGTINISGLSEEISKGDLLTIPERFDSQSLLANDICQFEGDRIALGSSFIIPGKGGITPSPVDGVDRYGGILEWTQKPQINTKIRTTNNDRSTSSNSSDKKQLQPAVGWYRHSDGTVVLTANPAEVRSLNQPIHYLRDCLN